MLDDSQRAEGECNKFEIDVKLPETDLPWLLGVLEPNVLYARFCKY